MTTNDKLFLIFRNSCINDIHAGSIPLNHILLYSPTKGIAADITYAVTGRQNNLFLPREVYALPDDMIELLKQYLPANPAGEGEVSEPHRENTIIFKELVGEQYAPVVEALAQFKKTRVDLGELLSSAEIIQQAHPEKRAKAVPSTTSPLDPSALDSITRARLEGIIGQYGNNSLKKKFFPPQQTEELKRAEFELVKDSFERGINFELGDRLIQVYEGGFDGSVKVHSCLSDSPIDVTGVLACLDRGVKKGFFDEESRRAKVLKMYTRICQNQRQYSTSLVLYLVHKFKLDEQFPEQVTPEAVAQLKQRRLAEFLSKYGLANGRYNLEMELKEKGEELPNSYIGWIKKAAEGIPAEVVFQLASEAYAEIILPDSEMGSREEEPDYLRAAMLVREYLVPTEGEEILLSIGKKLVETSPPSYWTADIGFWHQCIEKDFAHLNLPEEMTRPMWLKMLVDAVENGYPQIADKIKQNHVLPDEEIRVAVGQPYGLALLKGEFTVAFRLGDYFSAQLPEPKMPVEDLRKMAGIEEYVRLEAEREKRQLEL